MRSLGLSIDETGQAVMDVEEAIIPYGVIGLNYRTADLGFRSLMGFAGEQHSQVLRSCLEAGLEGALLLTTCNRTELYFANGTRAKAQEILANVAGIAIEELTPHLYLKEGLNAATHLFKVCSGLDSAVLGENDVLAQVKNAVASAKEAGALSPVLAFLFQRAFEVSKRVRSETEIGRGVTSVGTLAVHEARKGMANWVSCSVLLVGAGSIALRIAKELAAHPPGRTTVTNRTLLRAQQLAGPFGFESTGMENLRQALTEADVVISAAASETPLLTESLVADVVSKRDGRPLTIVDLGVPANFEEGVRRLSGVQAVDMDRLVQLCAKNSELRMAALPDALEILEEEILRLERDLRARSASPTIQALVQRGEQIRDFNLDWARERLEHLGPKEMRVVEEMARRLTIGFLQTPIEQLKGELADPHHRVVVEKLFELGPPSSGPWSSDA